MSVQEEQEIRQRFDTVQDGYDPAAVDRVIESLEQALDDLAAKYEGLEQADLRMRAMLQTANERVRHQEEELSLALDAAREQAPVEAPPALDGEDAVRASSEWAARLLAISTRDAEKMVAEAREEAGRVVANARTEAARTIQQNLSKLHAREEALEVKEEEQRKALDRMREETLLELESRRDEVEADVRRLREFEARSRTELVSYFREQLDLLERPQVVDIKVGARVGESRAS
jgi:cell division septum initiation protein DivIVA